MSKFNWRLRTRTRVEDDTPDLKGKAVEDESLEDKPKETESPEESKSQRVRGEVVSFPKVNRNADGQVTSMSFEAKIQFKGTLTVKARGDLASAYWSVTPGMKVALHGVETGDKEFDAEGIDIISAV